MSKIKNLFKNIDLISLGYNCYFKKFTKNMLKINTETNYFDYAGISMWAINELFNDNFANVYNKHQFDEIQIMSNETKKTIVNKYYYIRFIHDIPNITEQNLTAHFEKYKRRQNRLYNILNTRKNIIFLRFEEYMENRIIYPEYVDKFKITEFEYLKIFYKKMIDDFKIKKIKIIYLSYKEDTFYDVEYNIIIINISKYGIISWGNCENAFNRIFNDNYDFLTTSLNN
jgi:hypothetical protein